MASQNETLEINHNSERNTLGKILNFVKRHRNKILLILSIVMIILAIILVYLLITRAFEPIFKCAYLVDGKLQTETLCTGFKIPTKEIEIFPSLPKYDINLWVVTIRKGLIPGIKIPKNLIQILPPLDIIDGPLKTIRLFVVGNIILAFAVASLVMAFIAIKIKGFINLLRTPEGRKAVLVNLNLWLLIFAIFCSLFYFKFVFSR